MTSTTETTNRVERLLSDPFFDANSNVDLAGFTLEERSEINRRLGRPEKKENPFDTLCPDVITNTRSPREEYAEMLRDPEVRAELAQRDPRFAEQYEAEEIERIVAEFRRKNPDYIKTERNADAVIGALAKAHLGKDWLDNEDAAAELYRAGHWSVDELTKQFKAYLKAGLLDVSRGQTKELTKAEKLDVIAAIRESCPEVAIVRYLTHAFGGKLPYEFHGPRQFMATYPQLCSKAALFVWLNSRVGLDQDEFAEFQKSQLSRTPLLTFELIDDAWRAWQESKRRSHLFSAVDDFKQRTAEPEDLDHLTDAELDRRLLQARKEARQSR